MAYCGTPNCYECCEGHVYCHSCGGYKLERLERENHHLREEVAYLRRNAEAEYSRRYMVMGGFSGGLNMLPEPEKNMGNKLSILARKVLDKDLRTLVKAEVLDDSLEVTEEGINFLLSDYLAKNKKRLAADARKELKRGKK